MNLDNLMQQALGDCRAVFDRFEAIEEENTRRVLEAFRHFQVADRHFAPTTGYGYDDISRDTLESIYARLFRAEAAIVRPQLTSGTHTIPMSEIVVSSSDTNLPAPVIPASGAGSTVLVTGGGSGTVNSLVTVRNATWTFGFANSASWSAGNYSGQLQFTASVP